MRGNLAEHGLTRDELQRLEVLRSSLRIQVFMAMHSRALARRMTATQDRARLARQKLLKGYTKRINEACRHFDLKAMVHLQTEIAKVIKDNPIPLWTEEEAKEPNPYAPKDTGFVSMARASKKK